VNGLKGICCFLVFFHHLLLAFYPATYFGAEAESKMAAELDIKLSYQPYGILNNGNFWVCVFLVISAFLFAKKVMREKEVNMFSLCVKRYLRLMIPVGIVGIANWILIHAMDLTGLNYIHKTTELSVVGLLQHILFNQWFTTDILIAGHFWTMHLFFFGAIAAAVLAMMSSRQRWYMPLLYLLIAYGLSDDYPYYLCIVSGVIIADWVTYERWKNWSFPTIWPLGVILILAALFLGAYPSYVNPEGTVYRYLMMLARNPGNAFIVFHSIGAALLMIGICMLPRKRILESKLMNSFGQISFAFYLLHMMVLEYLGYYLKDMFEKLTGNMHVAAAIAFFLCLVVLVVLSVAFHRYVEKWCSKSIARIVKS